MRYRDERRRSLGLFIAIAGAPNISLRNDLTDEPIRSQALSQAASGRELVVEGVRS